MKSLFAAFAPVFALLWAGAVIGGSLVAAPSKFRAPSLDVPTALEVGRAQFYWIGATEAFLCAGLIAALAVALPVGWRWAAGAIALFAIQRLGIMPALDARTLQVINGESVGDSSLHLVFIVLEVVKVAGLVIASWVMVRQTQGRSTA